MICLLGWNCMLHVWILISSLTLMMVYIKTWFFPLTMISLACLFRRTWSHNHQRWSGACHRFIRQLKCSFARQCRSYDRLPSAWFSRRTTAITKTVNSFMFLSKMRHFCWFWIDAVVTRHTSIFYGPMFSDPRRWDRALMICTNLFIVNKSIFHRFERQNIRVVYPPFKSLKNKIETDDGWYWIVHILFHNYNREICLVARFYRDEWTSDVAASRATSIVVDLIGWFEKITLTKWNSLPMRSAFVSTTKGVFHLLCTYVYLPSLSHCSRMIRWALHHIRDWFQMSSQQTMPPLGAKPSRWGHPLVFVASLVGIAGSGAVYYANVLARQKARSMFLEQTFFEEALELTRGYRPISEKLVEPIQPLQLDPMSKFNVIALNSAQVSAERSFYFLEFSSKRCARQNSLTAIARRTERLLFFR